MHADECVLTGSLTAFGDVLCCSIERGGPGLLRDFAARMPGGGRRSLVLSGGGRVDCVCDGSRFVVDARNVQRVVICMPPAEWRVLSEAVAEHMALAGDFPLDHPLEPCGASFRPEWVRDFVFETLGDGEEREDG